MPKPRKLPPMRTVDEIKRAHDLLVPLVTGAFELKALTPEMKQVLHATLDCICWVLNHNHNTAFAENLERIEALLHEEGVEMKRIQ